MYDIDKKIDEVYEKERRVYPCRSNRASQLGHPCERYLVYMRTAWDKQTLHPVELEYIFEGGRVIEKIALQRLEKAGFNPTNQGRDFEEKKYSITGHIDTMIEISELKNGKMPCEIKGISPFEFDKINSTEDMLLSKRFWMRQYPAQLQLYLLMSEKEIGLFFIINKLTFKHKTIWMAIDYEFCEELVKKAIRIDKHIAENTLPDRIDDFDVCMNCSFRQHCMPDLKAIEGVQFIDDIELEENLNRIEELKPLVKEYEELDSKIKKTVEGKEKLSVGKWLITGKWVEFLKAATQEQKIKFWKRKVIKL